MELRVPVSLASFTHRGRASRDLLCRVAARTRRLRSAAIRTVIVGLAAIVPVHAAVPIIPPPPDVAASGYLLIDADSGLVLAEHQPDVPLPPASLTKIMTSYIAAHELAEGRVSHDDEVLVSVTAWRTPGSRTFIREGTRVRFEDLLRGMIIQSGNDASVAIAEHIAGSESAFAEMMNRHARRLGMTSTNFLNATGLPAEGHRTTARDLAIVTRAMIQEFPEHYAMYSERSFTYNDIDQPNRNRLLWRDRTVDGVKTGHTSEAGYCLVSSAERDGMRLISVVMGTASDEARMRESNKLLSYGFRYYETQELYAGLDRLKVAQVWYGDHGDVALGVQDAVYVTIPRGRYDDLRAELDVLRVIKAPFEPGQELGTLRLQLDDEVVHTVPLIALTGVAEAGFLKRLWHGIALFFRELFR
jgi:serine-type D-Ala-D-Ala carboxypeptidase (penicillin-binding protein 5/6)